MRQDLLKTRQWGYLFPSRGLFTEEARQVRLSFLKKQTGCDLNSLKQMRLSPRELVGNIECLIGAVEIPTGIGGPLLIHGHDWSESIYVPLATTEGALVSSVIRGAKALNLSGGVVTRVLRKRMSRAPMFDCGSFVEAIYLKEWIQSQFENLQEKITECSNHAQLIELEFRHVGPTLHVVFHYDTKDAAGQNMVTVCTWHACQWIQALYHSETGRKIRDFMLEANMSTDKKASYHSILQGRGRETIAEVIIPRKVIEKIFGSTPEKMVQKLHQSQSGPDVYWYAWF